MKRALLIIVLFMSLINFVNAQNYLINFAGSGAATSVDSVKVENLTQGLKLSMKGTDILNLGTTGIYDLNKIDDKLIIYPNPMEGQAEISFKTNQNASIQLCIYDISARKVLQINNNLPQGTHKYKVACLKQGMYFATISSEDFSYTAKIISQNPTLCNPKIEYIGSESNSVFISHLKNTNSFVNMAYNSGDRILFKGISGIYSTVLTDVPTSNKTITFSFVPCNDYDNNHYTVVQINSLLWMEQNLNTKHFENGNPIPNITNGISWGEQTASAYCEYNNDTNNAKIYGRLYNYYAFTDTRNICPSGWRIPTQIDWTNLNSYLGGEYLAGGKLKETGLIHWDSINTGATNETGFTAVPGGIRFFYGFFGEIGNSTYLWAATTDGTSNVWGYACFRDNTKLTTNNIGLYYGASVRCVKDVPVIATLTTTAASSISYNSAVLGGNITSNGFDSITTRGVCYSTSINPTIANSIVSSGNGIGSFTSNLTNLIPNTTYYARAYATNNIGTAYGNQVTFATLPIQLATLTTTVVTSITLNSAVSGGTITSDGGGSITTRGICYSTSLYPTIADNIIQSGNGTGTFTSNLTNLTYSTSYHVRAYATNSAGTAYGNDIVFSTLNPQLPTITTTAASLVSYNTATTGGNLTSDGGLTVTDLGNCYSTGPNPTTANTKVSSYTGTNLFTLNLYSLSVTTTYYVRAFATNSAGTNYGNQITFTTTTTQPPTLATLSPIAITLTSAISGGNVLSDGGESITGLGVCYSTDTMPTINNSNLTAYLGNNLFKINITNLIPYTKYYLRAYATNMRGAGYGPQFSFNTLNDTIPGLTVTDADGNAYDTVHIGAQVWMKQNLRTSKFKDGTLIPIETNNIWGSYTTPAYCYYANDEVNNKPVYGALYNWYAVNTGNLCPTGWKVPGETDWNILNTYLGAGNNTGDKLKGSGTLYWMSPNSGTNETGFSALPGGFRPNNGCSNLGSFCGFWTTSTYSSTNAIYAALSFNTSGLITGDQPKGNGYSIRCLKDSSFVGGLATASTNQATNVTSYTATTGGNVTADGGVLVIAKGICYGTSHNPIITNNRINFGTGLGSFIANLTNLNPHTTYYIRTFATNSIGTKYGNEVSLTTGGNLPNVTIGNISSITSSTANVQGNVVSDSGANVTARGICFNIIPNPTIANTSLYCGIDTGAFIANLTNLLQDTTYYARAFAINGVGITYSNQIVFSTLPGIVIHDTVKDIEGNIYDTIHIGNQIWLKQNLKTSHMQNGQQLINLTTYISWINANYTNAYCWYNNDSVTYKNVYGAIYNWNVIYGNTICPLGWKVPENADFDTLASYLGGYSIAGGKLKEAGTTHWNSPNTGATNESRFTAEPAGGRDSNSGNFYGMGTSCCFWTMGDLYYTHSVGMSNNQANLTALNSITKLGGLSIRCTKNPFLKPTLTTSVASAITVSSAITGGNVSADGGLYVTDRGICYSTNPTPTIADNKISCGSGIGAFVANMSNLNPYKSYYIRAYATNSIGTTYGNGVSFITLQNSTIANAVADIDGNLYDTIRIGSQVWFKQNLKVTKYNNGDTIPYVSDSAQWANLSNAAYCVYNNNSEYVRVYGYLYNFYTVVDPRNLCPIGWHVPTKIELVALSNYLGGDNISGKKLKEKGTAHWVGTNSETTNETDFTSFATIYRKNTGDYLNVNYWGTTADYWSSTSYSTTNAWSSGVNNTFNSYYTGNSDKKVGISVRCIKN